MSELNEGEVITIEDGVLKVSTCLGVTGKQEYELEFPVDSFIAWTDADACVVRLAIDDSMARRLTHIINDHMGETQMIEQLVEHVEKFMLDAGQHVPNNTSTPPRPVTDLRLHMLNEEVRELEDALSGTPNIVEVADALADIIYVAVGGMIEFGLPAEAIIQEVCRSNDTKRDPHTGRFSLDSRGKVTKPEWFEEPRLREVIESVE